MIDDRDTGEHFLDVLAERPPTALHVSAARVADLATQIEFLDSEVARYRRLIEAERIRHATELAELRLDADSRVDEERRKARVEKESLLDTQRRQLSALQLEHEAALSSLVTEHADALAAERRRYESMTSELRARYEALLEGARRHVADDLEATHAELEKGRLVELERLKRTVERLENERDRLSAQAEHKEELLTTLRHDHHELRRRLEVLGSERHSRIDEAERRAEAARRQLETERRKSSATLAELLERSASIAGEADRLRSEATDWAEEARAAWAQLELSRERETALESLIADLRAELDTRAGD